MRATPPTTTTTTRYPSVNNNNNNNNNNNIIMSANTDPRKTVFGQLVIGPPGSGKTTYCHAIKEFLTGVGRKVRNIAEFLFVR